MFEVPAQNIVFADTAGHIGYQSPGRIPVRTGYDGRWPAQGWTSDDDWDFGYRADRITDRLTALTRRGAVSADDLVALQGEDSAGAAYFNAVWQQLLRQTSPTICPSGSGPTAAAAGWTS